MSIVDKLKSILAAFIMVITFLGAPLYLLLMYFSGFWLRIFLLLPLAY